MYMEHGCIGDCANYPYLISGAFMQSGPKDDIRGAYMGSFPGLPPPPPEEEDSLQSTETKTLSR